VLNSHDRAKEFINRVDKEINWLMKAICTSEHPICSAPTDIAMKGNGKGDSDATLSLQVFKVYDTLA